MVVVRLSAGLATVGQPPVQEERVHMDSILDKGMDIAVGLGILVGLRMDSSLNTGMDMDIRRMLLQKQNLPSTPVLCP